MIEKNNKLIKQIVVYSCILLLLCSAFWVAVGVNVIVINNLSIFIIMGISFILSICIFITASMIKRFYLNNIRDTLKNLENLNTTLRKQRHEYLNEMQIVYGLLELEEYEEAYKYLKPVYEDTAKVGKALRTKKPAVNALIQAKMEYAQKNEINFYIEVISDLSDIDIKQWELCKVIGNVIDNAFYAVKCNEGSKKVCININEDIKNVIIRIENNGPEIPDNKKKLIFKQGYTSKKEEGHGMGLSIVSDILRESGGSIELISQKDKTEFCILFPKRIQVSKAT